MADRKRHIDIMGIVNLTDDSFYSGSRVDTIDGALDKAAKMLAEGADIIDLGACSTAPGNEPVGEDVEWKRLKPVLKTLREAFPEAKLSIDTFRAEIVRRCFDAIGPFWVNDVSGGADEGMLPLVASLGLTYIATYSKEGYTSIKDAYDFFRDFSETAEENGIKDWILDPGIGFAKTLDQNYDILNNLDCLAGFMGRRLLVGVSRKSMIYKLLDISPEDALAPTQVVHYEALRKGADILRVHDVAAAIQTVQLYRMFS